MFKLSESGEIILDPNILSIKEFEDIYKRDKDKNKLVARKELKYIYFISDYVPPYSNRPLEERYKIVGKDIFKNEDYKPDSTILKAIEKYNELNVTPTKFLLQKVKEGLYILGNRLGDKESPTKDILATLKQVKETILNYEAVKEAVEKETSKGKLERGRYIKGNREDPR